LAQKNDGWFIQPLGPASVADFFRLRDGPACNGCYCMAWRVPTWKAWETRTPEQNRNARQELFRQGVFDGLILMEGSEPIGWCQLLPVNHAPKLQRTIGEGLFDQALAISCLLMRPDRRGQGRGSRFLWLVVEYCRRQGLGPLIGLPQKAGQDAGEIWNGTEGMFARAGFRPQQSDNGTTVYVLDPRETAASTL
jgi:GNAT superfamily N-acetyltransferase